MSERKSDLLTIDEAAAYLRTPKATLYGWVRTGKLASYKLGTHLLFKQSDLDAFMESRRRPAMGERKFKRLKL